MYGNDAVQVLLAMQSMEIGTIATTPRCNVSQPLSSIKKLRIQVKLVMNESAYLFQVLNCYVRFDGIPLCVDVQTSQFVTLSMGCYLRTCELFIWVNSEDCPSISTPFGYRSHDFNVACLK